MGDYAIIAGPALDGEPGEVSVYPIVSGAPLAEPVRAAAQKRSGPGRPREAPRSGDVIACFCPLGVAGVPPNRGDVPAVQAAEGVDVCAVGFCKWSFVDPSDEAKAVHAELNPGPTGVGRSPARGLLQYTVRGVWALSEPTPTVELDVDIGDPVAGSLIFNAVRSHIIDDRWIEVGDLLAGHLQVPMAAILLQRALLRAIFLEGQVVVRSVRLGARTETCRVLGGLPPLSLLTSWRRVAGMRRSRHASPRARAQPRTHDDILLEWQECRRDGPHPRDQRHRFFHASCGAPGILLPQ